jgi:DNA-binding NarL/FixJ family response regulator
MKQMKQQTNIRIILVDDHKIMRDGLRTLIKKESGMEVIAEAETGRKAIQLVQELKPDVAIMDIAMPDLNGIDATKQIITQFPDVKIIALSMHSDRRFVAGILEAGASGYLLKDCAFEELARAIREVIAGRIYLSPGIIGVVIKDYVHSISGKKLSISPPLTMREREVLQLLAEGQSAKEIALGFKLSVKTVETHRQQIMNKLNIRSIAELTKYAIREGLTTLED